MIWVILKRSNLKLTVGQNPHLSNRKAHRKMTIFWIQMRTQFKTRKWICPLKNHPKIWKLLLQFLQLKKKRKRVQLEKLVCFPETPKPSWIPNLVQILHRKNLNNPSNLIQPEVKTQKLQDLNNPPILDIAQIWMMNYAIKIVQNVSHLMKFKTKSRKNYKFWIKWPNSLKILKVNLKFRGS